MDLTLTDEQEMLRDGLARFIQESYTFEKRRALIGSDQGFGSEHWRTFGDLGWLALGLPEEAGGIECSFVELALVMEAFGSGLVLEPYASNVVLSSRILARADNAALCRETLSGMAEGKARVALAHSEPQTRYALDDIRTTAQPGDGGYVLRGTKFLVLDGPSADKLIVSAQLAGSIALFLLDRGTPGVKFYPYRLLDDTFAADIVLDDVRVTTAELLTRSNVVAILEEARDRFILAKVRKPWVVWSVCCRLQASTCARVLSSVSLCSGFRRHNTGSRRCSSKSRRPAPFSIVASPILTRRRRRAGAPSQRPKL